MSFTDNLASLPVERLKEILRRRAFHIRSVPRISNKRELCAWMAQALSDAYAVRQAFEETDLIQARVLAYLVAQDGEQSRQALADAMSGGSQERVDEAANGLESLGLAIRVRHGDSWTLWAPDAVRRNVPLPLPVRHKLQPTLERYEGSVLDHILRCSGIPSTGLTTKRLKSIAIARRLLDPALLNPLESLSDEARKILEIVMRRGGATSLHELGLQLDTRRRNQLYSYDWSYRWHASPPRNPVEELLSSALLVLEGQVGFHYGAILVAGDLLERLTGQGLLTGGLPPMPQWQSLTAAGVPVRSHSSLIRDMASFLAYLARNPTGRTGKGIIHRTALKNSAKALSIPTTPYAAFLYGISRDAGLIEAESRSDHYEMSSDGEAWMAHDPADQQRSLYDAWLRQYTWCELSPELLIDDGMYVDREEVRAVRNTVIDLLREASRQFPADLVATASLTARARFRRWASFSPDPEPGSQDEQEKSDEVSSTELVARVLTALYWLGLLDADLGPSGELRHVRLTASGRSILLDEPAVGPTTAADSFVVQPNLEIYAPPNLRAELCYRLFLITDPAGGGMLALTRESLRKALDLRMTASEIADFLRQGSSSGLPQNVEYLIREVGGKHGHIRVGTAGLYVVVDDPITLKELAAQKKLNIHVRRQLSDTVALVTGESVDAVLKQLRQAGYLPVADRDERPKATTKRQTDRFAALPEAESGAHVLAAIDWSRIDTQQPARRR